MTVTTTVEDPQRRSEPFPHQCQADHAMQHGLGQIEQRVDGIRGERMLSRFKCEPVIDPLREFGVPGRRSRSFDPQ